MEPCKTMNFKANNRAALVDILRSIDINGPLMNGRREKERTEPYAIAHLLSSLAQEDALPKYPLELVHRDKPDFLLLFGQKKIGIEHTDARPENETHKDVLRNKERIGPLAYFITPVEPNEPRRDTNRLRKEIEENDPKEGWGDQDGTDQQWSRVMLSFIDIKEHKLQTPDFSRYDEDWLLVRDAWPFPDVNPENAMRYLFSTIQNRSKRLAFHHVFIISNSNRGPVCEISQSGFRLHPRNDLWLSL